MRKLIVAALFVFALACFAGASTAYAGDCCKPKCNTCKPKCGDTCKPKCEPCKSKCEPCKPKCKPVCKPKCNPCKPACEKPCKPVCAPKCEKRHPYEACFNGTGMMGDTGCCGNWMPCKRACVTCETVCKRVETKDPCTGCVKVEYVYETVCHEMERPRVIPWWFNEKGDGNIYPDEQKDDNEQDDEDAAEEND